MPYRVTSLRLSAWLLTSALLVSISAAQSKRPLNHHDYDSWRSITSQKLSNDGKFLAYGLFPQDGDGEVVIRNLVTGKEQREPAGARPAATPSGEGEEGPAPVARSITLSFSRDSKTLVFSTFPTKAETAKAVRERKTGDAAPKDGMVIVDLASGKSTLVARVRRFDLPDQASGFLAYLKEGPEGVASPTPAAPAPAQGNADQQGGRGGRGGAGGGAGRGGARPQFGSELILRDLSDSSVRSFFDVVEFALTDDAKQLVYAVSARDTSKNGVFAARTGSTDAPVALLAGKGKYSRLTWDENQSQLVF